MQTPDAPRDNANNPEQGPREHRVNPPRDFPAPNQGQGGDPRGRGRGQGQPYGGNFRGGPGGNRGGNRGSHRGGNQGGYGGGQGGGGFGGGHSGGYGGGQGGGNRGGYGSGNQGNSGGNQGGHPGGNRGGNWGGNRGGNPPRGQGGGYGDGHSGRQGGGHSGGQGGGRYGSQPPRGPRPQPSKALPRGVEILYEDDDIVVAYKPAGLLASTPQAKSAKGKATLCDALRRHMAVGYRREAKVLPVHDFDRDASGPVVFARSAEAGAKLREAFMHRRFDLVYTALVCGCPKGQSEGDAGTVQSLLVESARGVIESTQVGESSSNQQGGPRRGVTHYRVGESGHGVSLMRLRAETDHRFQVRCHMADLGCPIVGDRAYGADRRDLNRLALHISEIAFPHPRTGERVRYSAPPPPEFRDLIQGLAPNSDKGWDHVADWYVGLLSEGKSDLHEEVVWPNVIRMLDLKPQQHLLDVACGSGELARKAAEIGAEVMGIDASPAMIEAAREHSPERVRFETLDAADIRLADSVGEGAFDASSCVLALMNIDKLDETIDGIAYALKPGGCAVVAILHPAFRVPKHSSWGWDGRDATDQVQYRRVDAYLSEQAIPITMNPGAAAQGQQAVLTTTHHRPISRYISSGIAAGLVVDGVEEWTSPRVSVNGPRAVEENRLRNEIPMFMAIRFRKPDTAR